MASTTSTLHELLAKADAAAPQEIRDREADRLAALRSAQTTGDELLAVLKEALTLEGFAPAWGSALRFREEDGAVAFDVAVYGGAAGAPSLRSSARSRTKCAPTSSRGSAASRSASEPYTDAFERTYHELHAAVQEQRDLASRVRREACRRIEADVSFAPRRHLRLLAPERG